MSRGTRSLIGLDVNATRLRAVAGPPGAAQLVPLEDGHADLPLAVSLQGGCPDVGRAGLRLCRRLPHLACVNFLPDLGEPRTWEAGRTRLTAEDALALAFDRVRPAARRAGAVALALPAYLGPEQVGIALTLAQKAGLRVTGSLPSPLAVALAGHAEQPWTGPALVVHADDHALTWAVAVVEEREARLVAAQPLPGLGLLAWKDHLLGAICDRCVQAFRHDPRDSAPAEQALYEQLDGLLDAAWHGREAPLLLEMSQRAHKLIVSPATVGALCASLVHQAVGGLVPLLAVLGARPQVARIVLTGAAARLPGLGAALEGRPAPQPLPDGDGELFQVLTPEAVARAAHDLAESFCRGEVEPGHVESAPLPAPRGTASGLPRLQFQGREYVLHGRSFLLGHHAGCDLVLDARRYPGVAPRHCEVVRAGGAFVVRDAGGQGLAVNGRPVVEQFPLQPGDWIRLGPDGPMFRFLGGMALLPGPRPAALSG